MDMGEVRRRAFVALVLALSFASGAAADPPPKDELRRGLRAILGRFESDELDVRAEAQSDLDEWCVRAGDAAEDLLSEAGDANDEETASRLEGQLRFVADVRAAGSFLSAFDACKQPSALGRKFVRYNTGGYMVYGAENQTLEFQYSRGWIVEESEHRLRLASTTLRVTDWKRARELPKEWDKFKDRHPKGEPLPGDYVEIDFERLCDEELAGEAKEEDPFSGLRRAAAGENSREVAHALFARWAMERGHWRKGMALLESARAFTESQRRQRPGRGMDARSADEIIVTGIAVSLRAKAILGAQRGASRSELLEAWTAIGALPKTYLSDRAARMATAYRRLIAEDDAWKEPTAEELAGKVPSERADYWMHHLRDVAARQGMQPGHCSVLWIYEEGSGRAAGELVKLGWDAVPLLIEHMEDDRPTRSVGYWRDFDPASYHLLTYKDACQQIFEAITKVQIWDTNSTHDYPSFDSDPASLRRRAAACWKAAKEEGPERAYECLLAEIPEIAAANLLEIDKAKWTPKLRDVVRRGGPGADRILWTMREDVWKTDAKFLRELLECPSLEVAARAADWLNDFQKDGTGVEAILRRLESADDTLLAADPEGTEEAMKLLSRHRTERHAQAWAKFIARPVRRVRIYAAIYSPFLPTKEVVEAVLPLLDDTSCADDVFNSSTVEDGCRVCDWAGRELCVILKPGFVVPLEGPVDERDAAIRKLKAWYAENSASVNWELVWQTKR